jgi:hypothetical protein
MKRTALSRRTPLRSRSKKTARVYEHRRTLVARLLTERPICEVPWCLARSVDVHEPLTRARGGDILDPENCRAVCRMHHDLIHANAEAWIEDLGFLKHSWDGQ